MSQAQRNNHVLQWMARTVPFQGHFSGSPDTFYYTNPTEVPAEVPLATNNRKLLAAQWKPTQHEAHLQDVMADTYRELQKDSNANLTKKKKKKKKKTGPPAPDTTAPPTTVCNIVSTMMALLLLKAYIQHRYHQRRRPSVRPSRWQSSLRNQAHL